MNGKQKPGNSSMAARTKALNRLIDAHKSEFRKFYAEERVALGLPADPAKAAAEAQLKSLEEKVTVLRERLSKM